MPGDRTATFKSTQEYFSYVAQQDIDHLRDQPNSIDNATDARAKYKARIQLKSIISRFVDKDFDNTNFKLFCDDFRYANMLINNASDLKIVAVLDWEWAYAAPYQMFCSPPRWLTLRMPNHMATFDGPAATRFKECLNIFLDELELEEVRRNEMTPRVRPQKKLADYMRESLTNGRFWFHGLMLDSFLGADDLAWQMICQLHPDIDKVAPVSASELDAFVATKIAELEKYNAEWAAMKAKIDAEKASLDESMEKATLNGLEADGDGTNH